MNKIVLRDEAAKLFYKAATKDHEYSDFDESFWGIGGYWKENWENQEVWLAYDFIIGVVFIEEFDDEGQALLYAQGIEAITKDKYII